MKDSYSFKQFFQHVYRKEGQKFVRPEKGKEEMEEWQRKFRSELSEQLGLNRLSRLADGFPASAIHLEDSRQEEGYLRQKIVMRTLPFVEMPFYVLIPDGVNAANPARAMLTFPVWTGCCESLLVTK